METKRMIGSRIKHLRKAKGFSQEGLAERVGLSSKYLSSIERGNENPTLDTFMKLAHAMKIEVFELFNYSGETSIKDSKKYLVDLIRTSDKEKVDIAVKVIKAVFL